MKKIFFILVFAFAFTNVFAKNIDNSMKVKEDIKTIFTENFKTFKQDLNEVQKEQKTQEKQSDVQKKQQDSPYQKIVNIILESIQAAIESNERDLKRYSEMYKDNFEYLKTFQDYSNFYKNLDKEKIAKQIADYVKKNFDNMENFKVVYAQCLMDQQITVSFIYEGKRGNIFYLFQGEHIVHSLAQDIIR